MSAVDPSERSEIELVVARLASESEARTRSGYANAAATLAFTLLAVGPALPGGAFVFGSATLARTCVISAAGWLTFELATLAFHAPRASRMYRALATLDELGRHAVLLSLVYLSGSAASPLWFIALARGYAWIARPREGVQRTIALSTISHGALIAVFLRDGRGGDAVLTSLVLLTFVVVYNMTARIAMRRLVARAEQSVFEERRRAALVEAKRERLAREVHDGAIADAMALVLQLRLAADDESLPRAAELVARAEGVLGELRRVVWLLRDEQGTFSELGRMIEAACRSLAPELAYECEATPVHGQTSIDPGAALAAVHVGRALVIAATTRDGTTNVRVSLRVDRDLVLDVEDNGESAPAERLEAPELLESARHALLAVSGRLDVEAVNGARGVRFRAVIPLSA